MTAVLSEVIQLLTSGLIEFGTGIGQGLGGMVEAIFLDSTGDTVALSVFGGVIVLFASISLAVGLSRWVVGFVSSLGASH